MVADNEIDARADALLPGNALDVLFTSGTTGQPKGVVITHAQNLRTVAEWVARVGLTCEDRYLRIIDRLKDMYITGGFNCYPAETERALAAHPAIARAAVIVVPDARLGEVGKAYVVARPGEPIDAASLIAWCCEQVTNYKVPRVIEIVDTLPTHPSAKVLKFPLRGGSIA